MVDVGKEAVMIVDLGFLGLVPVSGPEAVLALSGLTVT
jgi:hypothetical protein